MLTERSRYWSRRSDLARTYKDTASCVEAIEKCNPCRKYANNAMSPSRRTRHYLLNRYRNQSEPYGSKGFLCSLRQRQYDAIPVTQMTRGQLGAPPMKPAVGRSVVRELLPTAGRPDRETSRFGAMWYVAGPLVIARFLPLLPSLVTRAALYQQFFRFRCLGREGSCVIRSASDRYTLCRKYGRIAMFYGRHSFQRGPDRQCNDLMQKLQPDDWVRSSGVAGSSAAAADLDGCFDLVLVEAELDVNHGLSGWLPSIERSLERAVRDP
jgi:phage tail protein X